MRVLTSAGSLVVVAFTALLFACSSSGRTKPAPAPAAADSSCPAAVPGTTVTVEDTETGAALVFVTSGDLVELRRRVGAMVTMHNQHHGMMADGGMAGMDHGAGAMAGMDHGAGGMAGMDHGAGGMKGMMMVPAVASMEDSGGGARIVLVAAPADVAALRDQVRMHAKMMAGGTCMMMGAH